MPWQEVKVLNQRNEFIEWLDRNQNEGLLGLMDKSRAPHIQSKV